MSPCTSVANLVKQLIGMRVESGSGTWVQLHTLLLHSLSPYNGAANAI